MKNESNSPFLESNTIELLRNNGLSPNDIKVYQYLIKNPKTKTGPIISNTKIASSATYQSLQNLIDKGLVSYEVRNNIKHYRSESPQRLIDDLKNGQKQLEEIAKMIEEAKKDDSPRNMVNIYEGQYGFKKAFQQFSDRIEKGESLNIQGYSTEYFKGDLPLRKFFIELDKDLKDRKIDAKVLMSKDLIGTMKKDRKELIGMYNIRTLPSKYLGPYAIDTSEKELLITILSDIPIAISIKHPIVVEAFRKNFQFLWEGAKEIE